MIILLNLLVLENNTNDQNFIWPKILHGCGHPNRTFYGIIIEKCRNTTLKYLSDGKYCKSNNEIIDYIKKKSIALQLIDQFTDMFNYTNPYRKYFYSVSNGLFEESYTTNHLNFNPSKLISDEGIFISNKKETLSYLFDLNEKVTSSSKDSGIYVAFYFWMQRRMQYYERIYEKFQDALSNVGGLCSIVLTLAELINYLVNHYIILFDMENYMNEIKNSKEYDKNIFKNYLNNKSKIDINNNSSILFPIKKKNINKDGFDIFNNKIKINKIKKGQKKSVCINNSSLNKNKLLINANNIYLNNNNIGRKSGEIFSYKFIKNIMKDKIDSRSNIKLNDIDNGNQNIIFKKGKTNNKSNETNNNEKINSNKIKFCHYLSYLLSLAKNNSNNIELYADFRIKMISEENLIMSNLKIDKLYQKYKKDNSNNDQELEANKSKKI